MESVMNNLNWEQEHKRFMTIAYDRTQKAAKRAFYGWHESKRPDAIAECLGKMWDQWSRLLLRGRNPEPMTSALIKYAILWVRYDRKIGGRSRNPDVYDYRGGFSRHLLSEQGEASTSERSSRENSWIDWIVKSGDDPAELASALEESGVTLAQWCDC
jgi:hypothetical protein